MDPTARLVMKLERRDVLTDEEKQALADAVRQLEGVKDGQIVVAEGDPQTSSRLLVEGICARRKQLADGRQQITAIHLPGDFVDLHSFGLKILDHDIVALTPARLAVVPHEALRQITETLPHLARMLWLSTLLDSAMHREWLTSSSRRDAFQHLGCLLCEIALRYEVVGIGGVGRWPFPLTQEELADVCGMTSVHINRTLQAIREQDLADVRGREIIIPDLDRLASAVGFDPAYLHIGPRPQ